MQMQTIWKSQIDPVLASSFNNGNLLHGNVLAIGSNVIYHKLGKLLTGWFIVDQNAASEIYRSAAKNDSTLTLNSSAIVTVDIYVF